MVIRNKILLLFFTSVTMLAIVLMFFRGIEEKQQTLITKSATDQLDVLINTMVNVQSEQLDELMTDYANWDEVVYLQKPNQEWAVNNLGSIVKSFNLYNVTVFNQDFYPVYSFGNQTLGILKDSLTRPAIIHAILNKEHINFFQVIPDGLVQISAASIHPSSDTLHSTPSAGLIFISRMWNLKFLAEISNNTASTIYFSKSDSRNNKGLEHDSLTVSKELRNFDNQIIGYLVIKRPYSVLSNFQQINNLAFNTLGVLLLLLLFTFFIILYLWIRRPLKIISDSLASNNTTNLKILEKSKNEFSQIARLITIFHRQKEELENENIEINKIQLQLIQQKSVLQGMALASNHLLTNEDFDTAIQDALEAISSKADIDRIFIYKNTTEPATLEIKAIRVHEYIAPEIKGNIGSDELKEIYYSNHNDGWYSLLFQGKTIKGLISDFREDIGQIFKKQFIHSMMIVPVIDQKNQHFWGIVGFADCTRDHVWSTAEETILKMLADNIGGAIKRQMSQEKLIETMEMAKTADRAKSEFLASMSHEIRTPMNGVIGMTSLLLLSDLSPSQREYVNIIENSGESLMNIINEILDFSKIESGRMELEETSFDLRLCIEDVLDLMAPKALEKHIDIIYFIDPMVHQYIFGDGFRLRQIIVNLVSNAIKFTDKGDILIYISQISEKDGNIVLEFSVKDTGIGIPSNKIDSLFSPFTQVDASTTRKYGGTGLGLAITCSLVKLMNGKIWVTSQEGEGSDFRFTLQSRNSSRIEEIDQVYKSLQNLPGKSVLIVDDNGTNRRILSLQCEYWGILPTICESGEEALVKLENNKYDVGIIDMQMPRMDGIMLAREIRKKLTNEQLPLIMLTSVGFNTEADELRKLFSFYVNKPIKHSQLAEILLKVIQPTKAVTTPFTPGREELTEIAKKFPFSILVAEDNLINQKLIRNIFELLGFKTDIASNGLEALEALKRKNYTLIFMDIQMPEMNGYEATEIIVARRKEERPIIIAMTANAMQGDREKCLEAGMNDYITKPMRVNDLVRIIKFWGEKQFAS